MEDDIKKIFDDARKLSLTADEKAAGREMFRAYMAMRPVRDVSADASGRQGMAKKPFGFALLASLAKPMSVFALVLALMLSVGGVSYAAEGALPGDALYPVKVSINEEVRAAAAVSAEERAKWETERAERRLAEAEVLASKGRLNAKGVAAVELSFAKHADKAKAHIAEAEEDEGADAAAELDASFEGALNAHQAILAHLSNAKADGEQTSRLAVKVDIETKAAVERREKSEKKVTVKAQADVRAAAEARRKGARRAVDEVRAQFDKTRARMEAGAAVTAEARLVAAEKALVDGDAKLAAEDYGGAFTLYLEAHRVAQEAKRLIKSGAAIRFSEEIRAGSRGNDDRGRKDEKKDGDAAEKPVGNDDENGNESERRDGERKGDFLRTGGALKVRF